MCKKKKKHVRCCDGITLLTERWSKRQSKIESEAIVHVPRVASLCHLLSKVLVAFRSAICHGRTHIVDRLSEVLLDKTIAVPTA